MTLTGGVRPRVDFSRHLFLHFSLLFLLSSSLLFPAFLLLLLLFLLVGTDVRVFLLSFSPPFPFLLFSLLSLASSSSSFLLLLFAFVSLLLLLLLCSLVCLSFFFSSLHLSPHPLCYLSSLFSLPQPSDNLLSKRLPPSILLQ